MLFLFPVCAFAANQKVQQLETFTISFPVEDSVSVGPPYLNLVAHFTDPSGKTARIEGFLDEEDEGVLVWRLRYTPRRIGVHTYEVLDNKGNSLQTGSFTCTTSPSRGFIKPDPGGRYLRYGNGDFYFALGHNVCWAKAGPGGKDFAHYFKRMAEAGANYSRIWLCSWDLALQGKTPGSINLQKAEQLDEVFASAKRHGIYLKLCIDNFLDYRSHEKILLNPYFVQNGGPCKYSDQFFSNEEARRLYRQKITYLIARWAHHPNLLAWEFWNEMNYVVDYGKEDKALMVEWNKTMAAFIRSRDPYGHIITTSLGLDVVWPELWQDPNMDIVQVHSYLPSTMPRRVGQDYPAELLDGAAFVMARMLPMGMLRKPVLFGEYGFQGSNESHPLNDLDETGIHLHNGIWASLMGGYTGTAMMWWWDIYIEPNNLYSHYTAMSKFLKGEDLAAANCLPVYYEDKGMRILALRGAERIYLWLQNKENTWYSRLGKKVKPRTLRGVRFSFGKRPEGRFRVEWWDTYKGVIVASDEITSKDGGLAIVAPPFTLDLAAKIYPIDP